MRCIPPLTWRALTARRWKPCSGAMEASFPIFRKYFKAKAKRIGKKKLAWWDIFAPVGKAEKKYTFDDGA